MGVVAAIIGTVASVAGGVAGAVGLATAAKVLGAVGIIASGVSRFTDPTTGTTRDITVPQGVNLGDAFLASEFRNLRDPLDRIHADLADQVAPNIEAIRGQILESAQTTIFFLGDTFNLFGNLLSRLMRDMLGEVLPNAQQALVLFRVITALMQQWGIEAIPEVLKKELPRLVGILDQTQKLGEIFGSGLITTLQQTTQQTGRGVLAAADLQAASLDNFLPTLDEWLAHVDRGEKIPQDDFTDFLSGVFRTISTPADGFPGEEAIPAKRVSKDLRVITVDQFSPWLKQSESWTQEGLDKFWKVVDKVSAGVQQASKPLGDIYEGFLEGSSEFYLSQVQQFRDVQPADGFKNASRFIVGALGMGLTAHLLSVAFEFLGHPLKHTGMPQIAGLIGTMAGFGPVANAIWGRSIGAAVATPAQYTINSIMHQNLLGEGEVDRAFGRRFIDEETYRQLLSFYATSKEDQDIKTKLAFRPPSMSDTIRIVRTSTLGETAIKEFLTEGGYPTFLIDQMIKPILQAAENSERTTLRFETRGGVAAGTVSPAEAELIFDRLDMRQGSREIVLRTGALQKRRIAMVAHAGVLESNFQADVISIFDLQSSLLNLGFQPDMVDIRVSRAQEKRLGKTLRTAAASTAKDQRKLEALAVASFKEQFKLGLIDKATFLFLVQAAGVDPFVALGIVALESIRLTGKEIRTEQAQVARILQQDINLRQNIFLEQFRKGQIDEALLTRNLTLLNLAPEIIEDLVTKEKLGKIPIKKRTFAPPEEVKARELGERAEALLLIKFRRGEIDADVLQSGLIELGGDPDLVTADVEIEVARRFRELQPPEPPKVDPAIAASKRRQISDLQRAFSDRVITADQFAGQLTRLVVSSDLIEALLEEGFLERALKEAKVAGSA